jgi:hypothetical protein
MHAGMYIPTYPGEQIFVEIRREIYVHVYIIFTVFNAAKIFVGKIKESFLKKIIHLFKSCVGGPGTRDRVRIQKPVVTYDSGKFCVTN